MKMNIKKIMSFVLATCTSFSLFACFDQPSVKDPILLENEYVEETATTSTATARWMDGTEFTPVLRFVAAADTHVNVEYRVDTDRRVENLFTDAYAYARTQEYDKLDAVIFCGDVCEQGTEIEYINLMKAWTKNIQPETMFLCLQAGHELIQGTENWHKEYTGNESLGMHVKINGYHFISISNKGNEYNSDPADEASTEWIQESIDLALQEDENKPIFTFAHHPVTDTIIASQSQKPVWNHEPLYSDVFKATPNVVNFTGHLHTPANHPRAIMQKDFTSLSCGPVYYSCNSSDVGDVTWNVTHAEQDAFGTGFLIVEVDAQNRIRVLPYNNALRQFYHETATGREDEQLIRYIENAADPSTWIYTEDRAEKSDVPYFGEEASIRNISFGAKDWYISGYDAGNLYSENGVTIKFDFDTAYDGECVELYRIRLMDKETGEYVNFHTQTIQGKHSLKDFTYYSSRYYIDQVYDWLPFESVPIKKDELVEGRTYVIKITAIDAFHVESEVALTAEFTYGA